MSNYKNRVLDSNGKEIEVGKRYIYTTTRGSMCDIDIEDRGGVLWGTGPFTEFKLDVWLNANDFESIVLSEEQPIRNTNRVLEEKMILAEFYYSKEEFETIKDYPGLYLTEYHTDRNALHDVWEKFRELWDVTEDVAAIELKEIDARIKHAKLCQAIVHEMAYGTLTDFYNAMVKAVEWYNSTVKN